MRGRCSPRDVHAGARGGTCTSPAVARAERAQVCTHVNGCAVGCSLAPGFRRDTHVRPPDGSQRRGQAVPVPPSLLIPKTRPLPFPRSPLPAGQQGLLSVLQRLPGALSDLGKQLPVSRNV